LKLLNKYHIIIIGDREFHSIELATWLKNQRKKQKLDFALRQKKGNFYHKGGKKYQKLSDSYCLYKQNIEGTNSEKQRSTEIRGKSY
jgi:hypothetical protein